MYALPLTAAAIRPRVGDLRQVASVRRIVLDDGAERGVRALAFSTGGGLDFWVLTDRSFDIGPLWFRGLPIAWQGPNGFRSPALHDSTADGGEGFMRSFSGFLVTCGLDHVRQPAGGRPLHGGLPFTPGRLTGYGEDWRRGAPVLYCEGEVTQARLGGEMLRLHRRIEAPVGGADLTIHDEVENIGPDAQAHDILYHFNLGFPAIGNGSRIALDGLPVPMAEGSSEPSITCRRFDANGDGHCTVVTPVGCACGPLAVTLSADVETLPWLQIWQDLRPHRHVLGIEPCASDRLPDGRSGPGPTIPAGASRAYRLHVAFDAAPAGAARGRP